MPKQCHPTKRARSPRLAKTQLLDVWYLFPLRDVTRQLAHNFKAIGPKVAKLDRVLGPEWRELYKVGPPAQNTLFDVGPSGANKHKLLAPELLEAFIQERNMTYQAY